MNTRKLALMGAFLFTLGIVVSANAEPKLNTNILSDQLQRQDSAQSLALGHSQGQTSFLAFPDISGRGFSVSSGRGAFEHIYGHRDANGPAVPNPEPTPMFLLGSGLIGLASIIRRRRRRSC